MSSIQLLLGMKTRLQEDARKENVEVSCRVLNIWQVLGKRWALPILKNLSTKDVIRFNELKRTLSGISSTALSDRLADLEKEGLVYKKIYPEVPLRVEYSLTKQARELESVLEILSKWAEKWESHTRTKS
jgi:DNA-binding HxlR family transcriptional regulator